MSISLGTGNSIVTAFGTGDTISAGDGNDIVMGPQGNATVSLGNGNQTVVLFGSGNDVSVENTANASDPTQATFVNAGSGNDTVATGDGTVFILGTARAISSAPAPA